MAERRRYRKTEFKREVLKRLQSASWMVDAGWTAEAIAAHYQRDRDYRAAVKAERHRAHWALIHSNPKRYVQPPYPRERERERQHG